MLSANFIKSILNAFSTTQFQYFLIASTTTNYAQLQNFWWLMRKCIPDEKQLSWTSRRRRDARGGWKVFTLPQRTLRFNSWIFKSLLALLFLINNSFSFIHSTLCVSEWNVIWVDNDVKWVKFQVHSKCHVRWDWQRYSSYYNNNESVAISLECEIFNPSIHYIWSFVFWVLFTEVWEIFSIFSLPEGKQCKKKRVENRFQFVWRH